MKQRSESVNDRAKALLDLIAPDYGSEIPNGYLSIREIARINKCSISGAQKKMYTLYQKGSVDMIKYKAANGKIVHYYGMK